MPVTIANSIEEISAEVGANYNLKPFPKALGEDGYLIFPATSGANSRGNYGHLIVARMAAVIPHLAALYKNHKEVLSSELKTQINEQLNAELIKKLQIVILMRFAGRWYAQDLDPLTAAEKDFVAQSSKECFKLLQKLGVNSEESEQLADLLLEIEDAVDLSKLSLNAAVLKDAVNLIENTELKQDSSPFCQQVKGN